MRTFAGIAAAALLAGALAAPLRSDGTAAAAASASAPDVASYRDAELQTASRDLDNGDWREAREKACRALKADKKSFEAWVVLGRSYIAAKQYGKAVRRMEKALKYDPHYAPAYYWKAKAFESWGKLDEAANEYQAAFHADSKLEIAKSAWKRLKGDLPEQEQ